MHRQFFLLMGAHLTRKPTSALAANSFSKFSILAFNSVSFASATRCLSLRRSSISFFFSRSAWHCFISSLALFISWSICFWAVWNCFSRLSFSSIYKHIFIKNYPVHYTFSWFLASDSASLWFTIFISLCSLAISFRLATSLSGPSRYLSPRSLFSLRSSSLSRWRVAMSLIRTANCFFKQLLFVS